VEFKRKFKLMVLQPGDLDLGIMVDVGGEGITDRVRLRVEDATADMPPSVSLMTNGLAWEGLMGKSQGGKTELVETTAASEIDIHLDTADSNTPTEPGELTKTFYVPEGLAKQTFNVNLPEPAAGLDEMAEVDIQFDTDNPDPLTENTTALSAAVPEGPLPLANSMSPVQYAQHPPVNTIDMSVGNLDNCFDEFEDIQLDTTEIDHDIDLALNGISIVKDDDAAQKDIEKCTPDISNTSVAAETPEATISEPQEELFDEETDDVPSLSAEQNADTEAGKMSHPDGREDGRET
jgi:hypothetical protein